ncbi:MAG: OPT/YSL family transporter [Anaeromyxobacter sp.]
MPTSPAQPIPELTPRALGVGLVAGAVLALANLSMGLRTGWWDSGSIVAALLAAALLPALSRRGRAPISHLEVNLAQTTATAVGGMPAAAGLLGAVPALEMLGRGVPAWLLAAWALGLGGVGVALGLGLRRRLLEEERLPFPTGVATARVIEATAGEAAADARVLAGVGAGAAALTVARDVAGVIPSFSAPPLAVAGAPAAAFGLGFAWSPMMAGAGMLVGPRIGLAVLGGAAIGWAGLAPWLVRSGAVPEASYGALVAWLAWPGVGLMLGGATVSLLSRLRAVPGALRDLASLRGASPAALLGGAAALLCVGVAGALAFDLGPGALALALVLVPVLGGVSARATGQTDISPAGEIGQLAQVAGDLAAGAAGPASLGVGGVVSGAASQASVSLWALRAGQVLSASARRQAVGLLVGTAAGALLVAPAYLLVTAAHPVGTPALPAPAALPWKALALVAGGAASLPRGAGAAFAVAFALGVLLDLLGRTSVGRRWPVPTPGAVGMGLIIPAHYALTLAAGALGSELWRRLRPAQLERLAPVIAAGAIAGESLAAVAAAALAARLGG